MKKLLLIVFLIPLYLFSQKPLRDSVHVKTAIFEIVYSEKLESPLWIGYKVLCPAGTASRKGMDFYTCDSIKTSDNADYVSNEWDKGHMAPAADFNCTPEMLKQTFTFLNCALQNQYLNRGVWKMLEAQEREWAKGEDVEVTIIVEFKNKRKINSGATVPTGFYKNIYLTRSKKLYRFYFPNTKPTSKNYSDFLIK